MPYECMSELVDRLSATLEENQRLRADLARVTAERDAVITILKIESQFTWRGVCVENSPSPPHNYIGEEAVAGPEPYKEDKPAHMYSYDEAKALKPGTLVWLQNKRGDGGYVTKGPWLIWRAPYGDLFVWWDKEPTKDQAEAVKWL